MLDSSRSRPPVTFNEDESIPQREDWYVVKFPNESGSKKAHCPSFKSMNRELISSLGKLGQHPVGSKKRHAYTFMMAKGTADIGLHYERGSYVFYIL